MNVYHFDMPAYLFRRGGWENREVVEAYASYAEKAFRAFGKEIRCWFTFNEPIVEPDQRYQNGVWYPCLHNFNRAKAVQYNISIAHSLAVAAYRRAKADGCMLDDSRIGLINCFTPPYTRENPSEADLEAVRMTDGINNRWWLDLVTEGKLPADILADFAARGSGCTLALLLDTFVFSKSKSSKTVAKMAILPGLFNINEPVIYGYPIVFNLPLMIPFVLVPDLFIAVTYGLTCAGIIAPCVVQVPWTTPAVISAFLTTGGDIRAAIWQVLEIVIAMAIYLPFMKVSERVQAKQAVLAEESAE